MSNQKVAYYYEPDAGDYYYGPGHPMKPHRLKLTHHLLLAYDLYNSMDTFRPHVAAKEEMTQFHSKDYVDFLCQVSPHNVGTFEDKALQTFNCGEQTDCPVFDGIGQYCATYAGGSIDGAARLNHGLADVCVNWSGGLHHAKKGEASGFCYINDIVLAILELLKFHPRKCLRVLCVCVCMAGVYRALTSFVCSSFPVPGFVLLCCCVGYWLQVCCTLTLISITAMVLRKHFIRRIVS
jgi:histone deacetylase 1/2